MESESQLKEESSLSSILFNQLKNAEYENGLKILKGQEYTTYLKHNSLDIVPIISKVLQEDFCKNDTETCIEEMLDYISCIANPKEALIAFLEEIEILKSPLQICVFLKALKTLLLKRMLHPTKRSYFSMVFNTLGTQMSAVPLPSESDLEADEKKLLDADPNFQNMVDVLYDIFHFYEIFYEKILAKDLMWPEDNMKSGKYLSLFILKLFHKPFTYLDIHFAPDDKQKNLCHEICSKFINIVTSLNSNPFEFLTYIKPKEFAKDFDLKSEHPKNGTCTEEEEEEEEEEETTVVSQLSLAVFFYCIVEQRMCATNLPCVYANEYLFFSFLPSCLYLLEEKESYAIHKGLSLFKSLLNNLHNKSLAEDCLEVPNHFAMFKVLIQVMTTCNNKECKTLALECLKQWILKFESSVRLHLFSIALERISHPGVLGVIIHELKENIRLSIDNSKLIDTTFSGVKLQNLLILVCNLPGGEETDLLKWSDKVMGALNLLIFIILHDPQNISNYESVLPKLRKDFLIPLEDGLRISKGHYQLKLKELTEGSKKSKMQLSVNGGTFPEIPIEHEKEMILHALNWFDIMQSVWARATKLVPE